MLEDRVELGVRVFGLRLQDLDLAEEIADAELGGEIAVVVVVPRWRWWCYEIGRYYRPYYYLGGTGGSSKALVQPWY